MKLAPPSEDMVDLLGSGDYALVEAAALRGTSGEPIRAKFALIKVTSPNGERRVLRHTEADLTGQPDKV